MDPLTAWCVDEALLYYTVQVKRGRKLAPEDTDNNNELIRLMKELQGGG